jgi:hypothetical protein
MTLSAWVLLLKLPISAPAEEKPRRQVTEQHRAVQVAVPTDLVDGGVEGVQKRAVVGVGGRAVQVNESATPSRSRERLTSDWAAAVSDIYLTVPSALSAEC